MKILLLIVALTVVSCASSSKKKMEASVKSEVKKVASESESKTKKEAEKKMATKKDSMKFGKSVTCNYGETQRVLENQSVSTGGCEVLYTKEGQEKSIASAENDIGYCQEIVDRVANKLVAAGYSCNNQDSSTKMQ